MIVSKDQIEKAEKGCVDAGLEAFMILTPPDDNLKMSATFHQMKSAQTVNVLINALLSAIDHELTANPHYAAPYAKIFQDFKAEFKSSVEKVNKKVTQYDAKTKKVEQEK